MEVGLIPCVDGGTSLNQWKRGGLLYDHAIYQTRLAERTSNLADILWHQGEADCGEKLYPLYKDKLAAILDRFREDLKLDDVPILLGGLGDFLGLCRWGEHFKNYIHVNEALKVLACERPITGFVSAECLTPNPDQLHFNAVSLREFGVRYYEELKKLENKNKVFIEKSGEDDAVRSELELL